MLLAPRSRRVVPLLVLLLVVTLAGCQVDVAVDVRVDDDGSGTVTVGVGADDDALARVGNLERQLRVEDLETAGWSVSPPTREGDRTWVRASKDFDTPDQGTSVLAELTGSEGPFHGFEVSVDEGPFGTDYQVTGTVDLRGGPASFGDEELAAALGGDPFGGTLAVIEQEEGRPISDMVTFQVVVDLPGAGDPEVATPSFSDEEPTEIDVSSSSRSGLVTAAIWVLVGVTAAVGVVVLRQGFRRVSR